MTPIFDGFLRQRRGAEKQQRGKQCISH